MIAMSAQPSTKSGASKVPGCVGQRGRVSGPRIKTRLPLLLPNRLLFSSKASYQSPTTPRQFLPNALALWTLLVCSLSHSTRRLVSSHHLLIRQLHPHRLLLLPLKTTAPRILCCTAAVICSTASEFSPTGFSAQPRISDTREPPVLSVARIRAIICS
ncbi:hypothetical protein VTI74DRAFT_2141 [Chaetomium olivicolor]